MSCLATSCYQAALAKAAPSASSSDLHAASAQAQPASCVEEIGKKEKKER